MEIYRISIDEAKAGTEGGRRFRTVAGRRHPSHGMAFVRTVLILSKSASLEHKSDATRLRRSPGVLDALEVRDDDDREIDIPGSRRRALLVRLALDAGRLAAPHS
ncbi:hypothetical protein FDG2_0747 [Candidatus Protofrankia californiensis]|uniref:Uncharacterized protein n=1 Tax=Candidatus Protofrankia californiensis TaxID=1839754 RepID=A0A1C3NU91_9ACTN|nr:hypothetical protein FDG2_0747 [Candidatus Protofrankia californiensis]